MNIQKVDGLIARLNETEPLSPQKRDQLYDAFYRKIFDRAVNTGKTWGEVSGAPAFYRLDDASRREFMKVKNQDLEWQCDTVDFFFSHHRKTGDIVPPHFPKRIAILLRKAKERDREKAFLEAWCRHFSHDGRDDWFLERLGKLA